MCETRCEGCNAMCNKGEIIHRKRNTNCRCSLLITNKKTCNDCDYIEYSRRDIYEEFVVFNCKVNKKSKCPFCSGKR